MVNYTISKNIHLETKKEFFFILHFPRNYQNTSFPPFQVRLSWKFLLVRLQVIWIFLHFLCLVGFAKFWGSKKFTDFVKCSIFCSLAWSIWKKNVYPDWVRLPTVKISAQMDEIGGFAGRGEVFDLGASESPWRWDPANLYLWQLLLYYSRSIYPFARFLETPEKGGPLKFRNVSQSWCKHLLCIVL